MTFSRWLTAIVLGLTGAIGMVGVGVAGCASSKAANPYPAPTPPDFDAATTFSATCAGTGSWRAYANS